MAKTFAFQNLPSVRKRRSMFDLSHGLKTSMSAGRLYPIFCQEVYPGDTFKDKTSVVVRVTSAFLKPVMDNCFMDTYFFFVPNRLVMDKWSAVMGENKNSAWAPSAYATVPTASAGNVKPGSVGDYLGLPADSTKTIPAGVNILPFRAYALIWDEWFRDQNNQQPMNISKGDTASSSEVYNDSEWSPTNYFGKLAPVGKMHDYFTSCLPSPQKGDSVDFGLMKSPERVLPVAGLPWAPSTRSTNRNLTNASISLFPPESEIQALMKNAGYFISGDRLTSGHNAGYIDFIGEGHPSAGTTPSAVGGIAQAQFGGTGASLDGVLGFTGTTQGSQTTAQIANLAAYDSGQEFGATSVNELRYAFALQRMLEKDALGGTRYTEYLLSHFGVSSPDARLNRSELLGGHRFPISVQQVSQTSQPSDSSPLGAVGAYSLSNGECRFTKGFVEHGFIIGVAMIRQYHTYQQGIERFWFRSKRPDYYDPVFANIGEQPVYKSELYALGETDLKSQPFGYNEAWADLRYRPNRVTGQMRSNIQNSLDIWHFADDYENAPTLNSQFIEETPNYIDRTLAVPSASQDQFIVDFYHKCPAYRCLPVYSTPSMLGR